MANEILEQLSTAVQRGKRKEVKALVPQAIENGLSAQQILNDGLMPGMEIMGKKFSDGEVFIPEMLVCARAMNTGTELLKPLLVSENAEPIGKACIGTIKGDLHDIGKNLVRIMLESRNIEVIDLGVDVDPQTYITTAVEQNCDLICVSALLTTTMNGMAEVVRLADEAGLRGKVRIMVGGAPVSQKYCDSIGADCYTADAGSAAVRAVELLQELKS